MPRACKRVGKVRTARSDQDFGDGGSCCGSGDACRGYDCCRWEGTCCRWEGGSSCASSGCCGRRCDAAGCHPLAVPQEAAEDATLEAPLAVRRGGDALQRRLVWPGRLQRYSEAAPLPGVWSGLLPRVRGGAQSAPGQRQAEGLQELRGSLMAAISSLMGGLRAAEHLR